MKKFVLNCLAFLLNLSAPIQKLFQRAGRSETVITKKIVDHFDSLIIPGDILLSHENQRPTGAFIRGFWDHAAIVSSKRTVIESVGDNWEVIDGRKVNLGGVRQVDLEEWLYKKDYVCLLRPTYPDLFLNKLAGANSLAHIGKGYDYSFKFQNGYLYCSELVYVCYRMDDPTFMDHIPEAAQILPIHFYESIGPRMALIFEYSPKTHANI